MKKLSTDHLTHFFTTVLGRPLERLTTDLYLGNHKYLSNALPLKNKTSIQ